MTSLVACIGAGKGTWNEVARLIASESWAGIFLVTNEFGRENFGKNASGAKPEFIVINDLAEPQQLVDAIKKGLAGKMMDTEVAVNMASGAGNVHMALISAMLRLGLGVRFVVPSESGAKEL